MTRKADLMPQFYITLFGELGWRVCGRGLVPRACAGCGCAHRSPANTVTASSGMLQAMG